MPINRFARYFNRETHRQLAEHKSGTAEELAECEVADNVFAFNNGEMLKLLKKRASHLNSAKFDKAKQVEE